MEVWLSGDSRVEMTVSDTRQECMIVMSGVVRAGNATDLRRGKHPWQLGAKIQMNKKK